MDDEEGARLDASLPPVIDAHVHVFPDALFAAIWRWFEKYGWPVRYQLTAPEVASFLLGRGVERVVCLHYAHKPGMSRSLNAFVAELCKTDARLVGLATVMPGEPEAAQILAEAKALGLRGVKLHCHVQAFAPDSDDGMVIFDAAEKLGLPVVVHAGREPRSPAYPVDTFAVCGADRMSRVLERFGRLRICVPHLGADEVDAYVRLLEKHDNLYLDTTMMLGRFLTSDVPLDAIAARPERIMYGTDFPNIPYAWDREIRTLRDAGLREEVLARVLSGTANELFG
ncbi:MAG: amidohydrolase [Polyangiaceae bacterium]|nr:amidohydrolase [Polyangiaceae bacterium]